MNKELLDKTRKALYHLHSEIHLLNHHLTDIPYGERSDEHKLQLSAISALCSAVSTALDVGNYINDQQKK